MNISEDDLNVTEEEDRFILTFHNLHELNLYNATFVKDLFAKYNTGAIKNWIVDISPIQYIDSSGIGVFISQGKFLSGYSKKLKLVGAQKIILRLFNIVGFEKIVTLTEEKGFD
jgi:anti-sigma B factor antagonist